VTGTVHTNGVRPSPASSPRENSGEREPPKSVAPPCINFIEMSAKSAKSSVKLAGLSIAGFALCGLLSAASFAAERADVVIDPVIAGPPAFAAGVWRTKSQSVFDPAERMLIRRMYMVWDPMPSRDLDFVWIPSSVRDDKEGKVNGVGRLIWRLQGKPAYDRASIFAEYRGAMKDGRADGDGTYFDATGISYKGGWKSGLMDGLGTLMLPGGDEYTGQMREGKANGSGRYIDVTGEIFEGSFVHGQRDGVGTTTLPNANSYRSKWVHGKETEDSRRLRLAQSTGQLAQAAGDDVRIGITIDKSKARDGDLVYAASSSGSRLTIQPDNQRLLAMWKGNGEIQLTENEEGGPSEYGVFSLNKGQLLPLTLVFEVQNRSATPIAVAGAYLAVDSSASDLDPAIQLNRALEVCAENPYKPTFRAENFGWGAGENAEMHFAFVSPNVSERPRANVLKRVGNIVHTANINLEPELKAAGVNTGTLAARSKSGFVCSGTSPPACLQQIKATGIFGTIAPQVGLKETTSIVVSVHGTLDYNWRDSTGASQTRSSPFNVLLPLGHIKIEAECGEGGEREVVAANPLQFKLDQTDYRLAISFQRSIPAGRTSQYAVTVKAAKSSHHDFTVVLQLADGREISSRPVNLLYYLPSWFWAK
jgi:hypothetical protein